MVAPQVHSPRLRPTSVCNRPRSVTAQDAYGKVEVQLFGDARVLDSGDPIDLTAHQIALVALTFGHGTAGLRRPAAATLLWGEQVGAKGRHRIRQLLYEVRRRVGHQIIQPRADKLVPAADVSCDLRALEVALENASLRKAAAFLARGFLGHAPAPTEHLEDWRRGKALGLHRGLVAQALFRWSDATGRGDWEAALDAAEALFILDPFGAATARRVITARSRVGDLKGAETAYARYLSGCTRQSQPDPSVFGALQVAKSMVQVVGHMSQGPDRHVRFIGRPDTLGYAIDALNAARSGTFEVVLISGESGIGKTRVLDEIHREAILRGFRCLQARAVEFEKRIPLNCLADALVDLDLEPHLSGIGLPWSSVVASVLPPGALRGPLKEPPPIRDRSLSRRLLDSFFLLFESLASDRPIAFFLDDLHWADATTVAALQFLQRRWSKGSFVVFATLRPELVCTADPVTQYLAPAGPLRAKQLALTPLTDVEARALVAAIAGDSVSEVVATRLATITGHHPLYLTELTQDYVAGDWRLPRRPPEELAIPISLERMLDARLDAIDDYALGVAGVLAVAARPLRTETLAELSGLDLNSVTTSLEKLLEVRFVEMEHQEVWIAHELFRSAIYRRLSEPRRAKYHRDVATWLLTNSGDECFGEAAMHFARAGADALAARYGRVAARRASAAGALGEAIQLLEVVSSRESDPVKQAEANAELAKALHLARHITRANRQLELASEQLRSIDRMRDARRLEITRIEGMAEVHAEPVDILLVRLGQVKDEARQAPDWEGLALALDVELHLLHRCGNVAGIRALLGELEEVARSGSHEAKLLARTGLALGVFFADPHDAHLAAQEAVSLTQNGHEYRLRALHRLLIVLQARGLLTLPEAQAYVREARQLAEQSGDLLTRFSIESNVAAAHLDAGDLARAESLMSRVDRIAGAAEMDFNRFIQSNNEAELALASGDYVAAADGFKRASDYVGLTTPTYMTDLVNAGLGYCALETGDLSEARRRALLLNRPPDSWYFDPTTILTFRARLMERRGQQLAALNLLENAAADLRGRLTFAWLKVAGVHAKMLLKYRPEEGCRLAARLAKEAHKLRLVHRAREFEGLLRRYRCQ